MYKIFTYDENGFKIIYLATTKLKAKKLLQELCSKYGEAEMISLKNVEKDIFESNYD